MLAFLAAARMQLWRVARNPTDLLMLVTIPFFTVIIMSITIEAGRQDLLGHAVVAPILIGMWMFAVMLAGDIVDEERWTGTLEPLVATPAGLQPVVLGRILTISGLGLLPVAETWLVAYLVFGVAPTVAHPWHFAGALVATSIATGATATVFAPLFVLARSALYFKNAMGYPFYILSGSLVPVSSFLEWLEPLSRVIFLTWGADLLRDAVLAPEVGAFGARVAIVLGLGLAGGLFGRYLLARILRRVRETGTLGHA